MSVIFIHSTGRSGPTAWPVQAADEDASSLSFVVPGGEGNDPGQVARRIRASMTVPEHVVAHSYGATAACRLAEHHPGLVRSLTLFEPAAFSTARGGTAVEAHIAAMTPVFEHRGDSAVSGKDFAERFLQAIGRGEPRGTAEQLEERGRALRSTVRPWEFELDLTVFTRTPPLAFTDDESGMYAEVTAALTQAGACHMVLEGTGHRPQDDPASTGHLKAFWSEVDA